MHSKEWDEWIPFLSVGELQEELWVGYSVSLRATKPPMKRMPKAQLLGGIASYFDQTVDYYCPLEQVLNVFVDSKVKWCTYCRCACGLVSESVCVDSNKIIKCMLTHLCMCVRVYNVCISMCLYKCVHVSECTCLSVFGCASVCLSYLCHTLLCQRVVIRLSKRER